jgi:putative hemolysin
MGETVTSNAGLKNDISYANSANSRTARLVIKTLENVTGRHSLIRRASGYEQDMAQGRSFWQVMPERYGLTFDIVGGSLKEIPASGPLIVIANHPYGILDGLMMGHLLDSVRGDFRILANSVFQKAKDLERVLLPISFDETRESVRLNLETRSRALSYLGQGGAIGVFPGGTVSTSARPFSRPMDPGWRNFTAKMIARTEATVVPVFFAGQNSRLFQLASHLHYSLRLGLLLKEFGSRLDTPVRTVIGDPIPAERMEPFKSDAGAMMDFLRRATYDLSPDPMKSYDLGYEFEAKYKIR